MSTATKSRKRVKFDRRIRLIKPIRDGMGALQITIGGVPHNYLIYVASNVMWRSLVCSRIQSPCHKPALHYEWSSSRVLRQAAGPIRPKLLRRCGPQQVAQIDLRRSVERTPLILAARERHRQGTGVKLA
jgi:hypothetical protein